MHQSCHVCCVPRRVQLFSTRSANIMYLLLPGISAANMQYCLFVGTCCINILAMHHGCSRKYEKSHMFVVPKLPSDSMNQPLSFLRSLAHTLIHSHSTFQFQNEQSALDKNFHRYFDTVCALLQYWYVRPMSV